MSTPARLLLDGSLGGSAAGRDAEAFTVSQLAARVADVLSFDPALQSVWLRGEVCDVSRPGSGHMYFKMKDGSAQFRCIMWRTSVARSQVRPGNGMAMVAHGTVRYYEAGGTCGLHVDMLFPSGVGMQQMRFELLHRRLESEGLFDHERKRPMPKFPRRIGIVTSPDGAVIHDLLTVLARRYPIGHVVICPAQVQGVWAPASICAGIRAMNDWVSAEGFGLDVLVVARGGGSAEDLGAFNDESVVRAVFASRLPVVSAVGHETDISLSDLAADLRAPTPSAAAEMLTPDLAVVAREAAGMASQASRFTRAYLRAAHEQIAVERGNLARAMVRAVDAARERITSRSGHLAVLSPLATMERGFALVESGGQPVTEVSQVHVGSDLVVRLRHGSAAATVKGVAPDVGKSEGHEGPAE